MGIKFAAALNCIDGRAQKPVIDWMKRECGVDYVDMITSPGMDKLLADGCGTEAERVKANAGLSVAVHSTRVVAVVGHFDCAANPASETDHRRDIGMAAETVASWQLPVSVVGLWVDEVGEVHVVARR